MANNFTVVDRIITESNNSPGEFTVIFKEFDDDSADTIKDWLTKNLKYSDIKLAPQLPDPTSTTNTDLYIQTDKGKQIIPFERVAFTGQYSDLKGAPDTADIANLVQNAINNNNIQINATISYDQLTNKPLIPSPAQGGKGYTITTDANNNEVKTYESFKNIAFTGDYEDVDNAPRMSQADKIIYSATATFNTVAFSGDYNSLIAPELPQEAYDANSNNGTYANFQPIAFTGSYGDLDPETTPDLFSGLYKDLEGAPNIPDVAFPIAIDPETEEPIIDPETEEEVHDRDAQPSSFHKIAFTGSYDSLNDAPKINDINGERPTVFNDIAFTGLTANSINVTNINPIISNILRLTDFSGLVNGMSNEENDNNNNNLHNFGFSSLYILGLNTFKNANNVTLINSFSQIISDFKNYKKPTYITNNYSIYSILDVTTQFNGADEQYHIIKLHNTTINNYSQTRIQYNNITTEQAQSELEKININQNNINTLIIDLANNILYFITANNLDYQALINHPITLNTRLISPNFATLINETDNNKILNLGKENMYLLNADQIVDENNNSLFDKVIEISTQQQGMSTSVYVKNLTSSLFVSNILYTEHYIQWDLIDKNKTNYNTLRTTIGSNNENIQTVLSNLTLAESKSSLFFDLDNNTIICKISE